MKTDPTGHQGRKAGADEPRVRDYVLAVLMACAVWAVLEFLR